MTDFEIYMQTREKLDILYHVVLTNNKAILLTRKHHQHALSNRDGKY